DLGRKVARYGAIGLYFAALILQCAIYLSLGQSKNVFGYANRVGLAFFLTWGCWLGFAYLYSFVKARGQSLAWPNHPVWTPAWVVVLLIVWNGLNPWIGLKTQTSLSMFSNLRSEGEGNHLFLKRIDLFPYQADMVEVVKSEPDVLAAPAKPRSIRYWAN